MSHDWLSLLQPTEYPNAIIIGATHLNSLLWASLSEITIYEKIENMSSFIVQVFFGLQIILTKAHYKILALSHFMC